MIPLLEDVESYCDEYESGFGRVSTLFSDDSTILEEVSIDYDENEVATDDDYCDETYAITLQKMELRLPRMLHLFNIFVKMM